MSDFFAFRWMLTPTLIQIMFVLGSLAAIAAGLVAIGAGASDPSLSDIRSLAIWTAEREHEYGATTLEDEQWISPDYAASTCRSPTNNEDQGPVDMSEQERSHDYLVLPKPSRLGH
jgi:hypothetical protein